MKFIVFTSNQPRHVHLINMLSGIGRVSAITECDTIAPGEGKGRFVKSTIMKKYLTEMRAAEQHVFGPVEFIGNENIEILPVRTGDLKYLTGTFFSKIRNADYNIIFGSSFIKGDLLKHLMNARAINIHMGISPYYRGADCNFWAMYDRKPEYVGATIHLLSEQLDGGNILFHVPASYDADPWIYTMRSVANAHNSLKEAIISGSLERMKSIPQNPAKQVRYSRAEEFTDEVAQEYLKTPPTGEDIAAGIERRRSVWMKTWNQLERTQVESSKGRGKI